MWLSSFRNVRFDGLYDRERFRFLEGEWIKQSLVHCRGQSKIRKTACLYSEDFNVYIDTSDGVNEDVPITEYCGRIIRVIEDAQGKPFLYFKCMYSPVRSRQIVEMARAAGGVVHPFFQWPHNKVWFKQLWPWRERWQRDLVKTERQQDVFMGARLESYYYPRPNVADSRVGWQDYEFFGLGSSEDTGWFELATRRNLYDKLKMSDLMFDHVSHVAYRDYLRCSFAARVVLVPPGYGEYSQRLFDHGWLGQAMVVRKTSYDFGVSWKEYIPEIDFTGADWEEKLMAVVEDHEIWEERVREYFEMYMTAEAIVGYMVDMIDQFTAQLDDEISSVGVLSVDAASAGSISGDVGEGEHRIGGASSGAASAGGGAV